MVNQFDRMTSLKFQERFWIGLANLLIKCEQFAELGFEDKVDKLEYRNGEFTERRDNHR